MEVRKRQEIIVLRDHEWMGKDEEEMAVRVSSDKDLNLGFTTAHILVTWTEHPGVLFCSVILHFTSNGSRSPIQTTQETNDPDLANHRTISPSHQWSHDPNRASQHSFLGFIYCSGRNSPCGQVPTCSREESRRQEKV